MMTEYHEKVFWICITLSIFFFLFLISGSVSNSAFASLVGISVGIASSAVG